MRIFPPMIPARISLHVLLGICVSLAAARAFGQDAAFDPTLYSTGIFHKGTYQCPQAGKGGDAYLNELKNRDVAPPSFDTVSVKDLLETFPQDLPAGKGRKRYRAQWGTADVRKAASLERKGVVVEGFILEIKGQGAEACNCGSRTFHDYHLWLSADPPTPGVDGRSKAVVAEISPRLLDGHPNWNEKVLGRLIRSKARFRISGWLTWDQEHPEQIGKTRGTLWEVHPIHRIEVSSGNQWRSL